MVNACPRALRRAIQRRADLRIFESPELAHHQRLALLVGQPRDRSLQMQRTCRAPIQMMRRATLERIYVRALLRDYAAATHPVARAIAAQIGCDPEHPRAQSIF